MGLWRGSYRSALAMALLLAIVGSWPGVAQGETDGAASVVVTTEVLDAIVADLVGDAAEVKVLMPGSADPHAWQPSARDTESIFEADFVVSNGLALEQRLVGILDRVASQGVPVFKATDHVTVRGADDSSGERDGEADQGEGVVGVGDPHFWLDPLAMRDEVLALATELAEAGIDVGGRAERLVGSLGSLDAELTEILAVVPQAQRKLVTGHDSLGYFAERYGFEVVGTVIPGQTMLLEPSARDLAALIRAIRDEGVTAVFAEVGTPQSVARVVAEETGAQVVELDIAQLPDGGSYEDLLRNLDRSIADALSG